MNGGDRSALTVKEYRPKVCQLMLRVLAKVARAEEKAEKKEERAPIM